MIVGFGFYGWIYWHNFTVTLNYDSSSQWLSNTRSIPCWTTSVISLTVSNGERRITAHTLNSCLKNVLLIYEWTLFYNFGGATERAPSWNNSSYSPVATWMSLLIFVTAETYVNPWQRFDQLLRCSGNLCLPNRRLANDHIRHNTFMF
jgi:hypothetical protein